ncbi:MAG: hypothetical protein ACK40K_09540, partial [Raineya sp.]
MVAKLYSDMLRFYKTSLYILSIFLSLLPNKTIAQFGKNGIGLVNAPNTILNQYTTLQTNVSVGANTITVNNIAELNNPNPLERGDLLLIIQMQGASIRSDNTIEYGEILNYNGAGNYEFVYVSNVVGNTISFSCPLQQNYTTAGHTQVIRVPQYQKLTIQTGASVTAPAWNGSRGG